ncbi:hydroxyisourate hydrolase [soil metagenome]
MTTAAGRRWLSVHVLDVTVGLPGAGMAITLLRHAHEGPIVVAEVVTNADGRTDGPLLEGDDLTSDTYELAFELGAYFGPTAAVGSEPFLDVVPVRFHVSDADAHVHVALLATPWSYTTYRGS